MRELDTMAVSAKEDKTTLEKLILQNEYFILKCASKASHRYITKSDDEWSIALIAFSKATESYELSKGSFLKFAELVIKRRLIDYSRNQGKYHSEIPIAPEIFDTPSTEDEEDTPLRSEVAERVATQATDDIKLEIVAAGDAFTRFGFSFFELSKCSPHAAKTKRACATAVNFMLDNSILLHEMQETGQLPLKTIEKNTKIPRKILERHRKYIIAAIIILSGDYPIIAEYLRYIKEES
jgi:RNA polymerase sigma factor